MQSHEVPRVRFRYVYIESWQYNEVYRDVKPENVLLNDVTGHVVLCDFDLATELTLAKEEKSEEEEEEGDEEAERRQREGLGSSASTCDSCKDGERRPAFVGTEEYVAPEVIKGWPHTAAADWWGLAILLYELTHGRTPFRARWREQTFDFITMRRIEFPKPEDGGPDPPLCDDCKVGPFASTHIKVLGEKRSECAFSRLFFERTDSCVLEVPVASLTSRGSSER